MLYSDLSRDLFLIAGPCVIESRDHAFFMASELKQVTAAAGVTFIFKASYDKANRSSIKSFRGIGMSEGLKILADIREKFAIPVLSDVHEASHCKPAGEVLDILQIPAFLSRQTDLLVAAGNRQNREREEGPVSGSVGNEERRRENPRSWEQSGSANRARRFIRV